MSLNVWYIDDEIDLCELFSEFFSSPEILITTFTDPKVALEASKAGLPDLMFIDFRLPGTTGDKVALGFPDEVPKYLITGDINVSTQYKFQSVFPKPYPEAEVMAVFAQHLKRLKAA